MAIGDRRDDFVHKAHDMTHFRQQFIRRALLQAGEDEALVEPTFAQFYAARNQVTWFAEVEDSLAWLSARYPLVAVSNGNADVHRVGLGPHFHAAFSAREFGVGKPDARIFHAAADAAGVRADEVLHVGDDIDLDMVGALGAGMQGAWLNRGGLVWSHATLRPHVTVASLTDLCRQLG